MTLAQEQALAIEEEKRKHDENAEESQIDQFENSMDLNEEYEAPHQEERQNQHSFLHRATFANPDTLKTTYLDREELGKPVFTVRWLLDMESLAEHYLDSLAELYSAGDIKINRISLYFRNKVLNITDSGMSKEGFVLNLNATKRVDINRKRYTGNIENLKVGSKPVRKKV